MHTSVFLKNYSKGLPLSVEEPRSSEGVRQAGRRCSAAARLSEHVSARPGAAHGAASGSGSKAGATFGWNGEPGGFAWALWQGCRTPGRVGRIRTHVSTGTGSKRASEDTGFYIRSFPAHVHARTHPTSSSQG